MKQENDSIDRIFRSKLNETGMPVRPGFWDDLAHELPASPSRKLLFIRRFSAAASVLLLLMGASAALWYFSPKEEIADAFKQVIITTGTTPIQGTDVALEELAIIQSPTPFKPAGIKAGTALSDEEEEEQITVSFSMSISYSSTSNRHTQTTSDYQQAKQHAEGADGITEIDFSPANTATHAPKSRHPWSLGVFASTGLLRDHSGSDTHSRPLSVGVSLQKQLSPRIALESGVIYTHLKSELFDAASATTQEQTLHYIGIPVKAQIALYKRDKMNLYTAVGGMVELCAAAKNTSVPDPIQLSLNASLGVQYKLSDRLSLYAEPGVSYHFDDGASASSIRKEKPLNMNLLCGVRMAF